MILSGPDIFFIGKKSIQASSYCHMLGSLFQKEQFIILNKITKYIRFKKLYNIK